MQVKKALPVFICLLAILLCACTSQPAATNPRPPEPTSTPIPAPPPIYPLAEQATLTDGDVVLKAVRAVTPWRYEYRMGERRFVMEESSVSEVDADGEAIWSIESPDGSSLCWLAAGSGVAYFIRDCYSPPEGSSVVIFRLDTQAHLWLPPFLPAGQPDRGTETITVALADGPSLYVLSLFMQDDDALGYRVSGYEQDKQEPAWSRTFEWAGSQDDSGGALGAFGLPEYAGFSPNVLSVAPDSVIVCPGEQQDILSLNRDTGEEMWRVERIWEYERGTLNCLGLCPGPYIDRFGIDWKWSHDEREFEQARKQFEDRFSGTIIGGPVVVPHSWSGPGDDDTKYSVFVSVYRNYKPDPSGYSGECVVYELRSDGDAVWIQSTVTTPQTLYGPRAHPIADGVIWTGENNSMLKLSVVPLPRDLLTTIEWYRQLLPGESEAWLTTALAWRKDPIALSERYAFRPLGGGYISSPGDQVYHFPLAMIDLQNGNVRPLVLNVPFQGQVVEPILGAFEQDGRLLVFSPYLLSVTWLEMRETTLRVVLDTDQARTAVDFEVGEIGGQ